jgi:hypothetical protein
MHLDMTWFANSYCQAEMLGHAATLSCALARSFWLPLRCATGLGVCQGRWQIH